MSQDKVSEHNGKDPEANTDTASMPQKDTLNISTLRELAERFAKDFGISYDKITIKEKTGWVVYKTDTGGSGGWTEGTPATSIPKWLIIKHYQILKDWQEEQNNGKA